MFNGVNTNKVGFADDIKGTVGKPLQPIPGNKKRTVVCLQFKEAYSELIAGPDFNEKIKTLADGKLTNIKSFSKAETSPNISTMTSANIISTDASNCPVYAWYDNGNIYWWSQKQ